MILKGDCLIRNEEIKSGSVDLILTDLPFGNMRNTGLEVTQNKKERKHDWDFAIEPKKVFEIANRILRKNGKQKVKWFTTNCESCDEFKLKIIFKTENETNE